MEWTIEPLFETHPMMFFSTRYPESGEVETNEEFWWYFRLRVMRACIRRVMMGMKRSLVRFIGIANSNAYMVMKMR